MRILTRSLIGLFLVSATLGLFVFAGATVFQAISARMADEDGSRPARERVLAVQVLPIEPQTITPVLETFGEVGSSRTLELRASAGGEVIWLSDDFQTGGVVKAGDLLLRIDPTDAEAARDTAKADLDETLRELEDARRGLELAGDELAAARQQADLRERALARQRDLADRGVGTAAAVEDAELAWSSANQAVLSRRQAQASAATRSSQAETLIQRRTIALAEAERRLADTEVTAPFAGVLSDVSLVPGRLVTDRERLGEIVDSDRLEVSFRVSTAQYARLLSASGQLIGAPVEAVIDVGGVDLRATGEITRESANVAEGQSGRLLFARLDDAAGFRPGDFVTVRVEEPSVNRVARLPASALDAASTVLVVTEDERLEAASVDLVRRQGDDVLVRARGLQGREVVAQRTPRLGAGIKVRPLSEGGAEPEVPSMVALDPERRARLVAFVEANNRMPADAKERVLAQLQEPEVPAAMINRIESRMGG